MRRSICSLALLLVILPTSALAQVKTVAQYIADLKAITDRADIKAANDYIDRNHESILHEWIAITEINAPSGHEQQRAKYIESLLRKYHLDDVHYDSARNLIAVRKGTGGGPMIVFDAHMDTVFQPGLQIKATIRDGKVYAPGIGDDSRNVEALLTTIRALNEAKIKTKGDLVFVFTVEEETTFRGVKTYVNANKGKIDQYIALDGGYEGRGEYEEATRKSELWLRSLADETGGLAFSPAYLEEMTARADEIAREIDSQ